MVAERYTVGIVFVSGAGTPVTVDTAEKLGGARCDLDTLIIGRHCMYGVCWASRPC